MMRLIDADELKDNFGFLRKMWSATEICGIIDAMPTADVTVQTWIPVSDETTKPKDRKNYFVAYVFGNGTITFFGEEKYHAKGGNGYVQGAHFSNEGVHGMKVTHWMEIPPLPEPPKECE